MHRRGYQGNFDLRHTLANARGSNQFRRLSNTIVKVKSRTSREIEAAASMTLPTLPSSSSSTSSFSTSRSAQEVSSFPPRLSSSATPPRRTSPQSDEQSRNVLLQYSLSEEEMEVFRLKKESDECGDISLPPPGTFRFGRAVFLSQLLALAGVILIIWFVF